MANSGEGLVHCLFNGAMMNSLRMVAASFALLAAGEGLAQLRPQPPDTPSAHPPLPRRGARRGLAQGTQGRRPRGDAVVEGNTESRGSVWGLGALTCECVARWLCMPEICDFFSIDLSLARSVSGPDWLAHLPPRRLSLFRVL